MRIQPNKEAALDFVGSHSWQEKEAMGIHNYIRMLTDLWPPGEPMVITRLQQPDGSHITGPSIAIEGFPSKDNQIMGNCQSQDIIMGGYTWINYGSCDTYGSNHSVCHCDANGNYTCTSSQQSESTC